MTSKKNGKEKDTDTEPIVKKEVTAYKYSKKGQGTLYEAIILEGQPCFVTWYPDYGTNNENIKILPGIEESTRIIMPPNPEQYPYTAYEFVDNEELRDYFGRANRCKLDDLYQIAKGFFQEYVNQDKNIITVLTADSILTYFQDLFPIIHYAEGIGGNDVGKSTIGYTLEYTGYRVIRGTSISGANYFRILGSVEPGQCTIIEDEGDSISEDPDKVRILKAGYEYSQKIPKTNMNTQRQEQNWFYPFCYKMILAEKSLSEWKAKGLVDRTFTFKCRPGRVRYSIKKVVSQTINKSPELQKLYDELLHFRKLIFCYRLIHYTDDLPPIKVSLINRDEELTYPLLQLFYGTEAFEEIKTALEFFIKQRRERRSRSTQAALYPILKKFIPDNGSNIVTVLYSSIWDDITSSESTIKGALNPSNNTEYNTHYYGPLYQNTLSKFISDNFAADLKHGEKGSVLAFDRDKFASFDDVYNHKVKGEETDIKIDVELVSPEPNPEGTEGSEGSSDGYGDFESVIEREENNVNPSPQPSEPSEPSAIAFIKCPHCKFENIHQDVIDHHIKFGHEMATR